MTIHAPDYSDVEPTPLSDSQRLLSDFLYASLASADHDPGINDYATAILIDVALRIIETHEYEKEPPILVRYPTSNRQAVPSKANSEEAKKAKSYLRAFVLIPRDIIFPDSPTEAEKSQRDFIGKLFESRRALYGWFRHLYVLIEDTQAKVRTASPIINFGYIAGESNRGNVSSPTQSATVCSQVRRRDQYCCKVTGIIDTAHVAEERSNLNFVESFDSPAIEVAHGIPWSPRTNYFKLLQETFGVTLPPNPDVTDNALLLHNLIHRVFSNFLAGFLPRSNSDPTLVFHLRPKAFSQLRLISVNTIHGTAAMLDGHSVLPSRPHCHIPDPDPIWFRMHWFLGGIFWMAGGAIPEGFGEDEDDEDRLQHVVTDRSIYVLDARLDALES